jgi:hypothetical protein
MARTLNKLTDRAMKALKAPGFYSDGGGLYIAVDEIKSGLSKHGIFRFVSPVHHRQRDKGLGPYPEFLLARLRAKAAECRELVARRVDPRCQHVVKTNTLDRHAPKNLAIFLERSNPLMGCLCRSPARFPGFEKRDGRIPERLALFLYLCGLPGGLFCVMSCTSS